MNDFPRLLLFFSGWGKILDSTSQLKHDRFNTTEVIIREINSCLSFNFGIQIECFCGKSTANLVNCENWMACIINFIVWMKFSYSLLLQLQHTTFFDSIFRQRHFTLYMIMAFWIDWNYQFVAQNWKRFNTMHKKSESIRLKMNHARLIRGIKLWLLKGIIAVATCCCNDGIIFFFRSDFRSQFLKAQLFTWLLPNGKYIQWIHTVNC